MCYIFFFFRLPQIYDEFYHTVSNADHDKDLRWWSNTHGVNMAMAWPQFEVGQPTVQSAGSGLPKLWKGITWPKGTIEELYPDSQRCPLNLLSTNELGYRRFSTLTIFTKTIIVYCQLLVRKSRISLSFLLRRFLS